MLYKWGTQVVSGVHEKTQTGNITKETQQCLEQTRIDILRRVADTGNTSVLDITSWINVTPRPHAHFGP